MSVIVPVYNGERYLTEALASVHAQSYSKLDLLVVDDGSTDSTPEILRAAGDSIRAVRLPHGGIAAALNHGVELARGSFLAFLDADDLWLPEKLALQMMALQADPGLDAVFGHVRQFHSPELTQSERAAIACPERPMRGISTGTLLIRRQAFDRVGPFDTTWAIGEFMDWYARATEAGLRTTVLPEVLMLRRLHTHHTRAAARAEGLDYARVARAALQRRRGQADARTSSP